MRTRAERIDVCQMILDDMIRDAKEYDGKTFNGATVAAALGTVMAGIAGLAHILKEEMEAQVDQ